MKSSLRNKAHWCRGKARSRGAGATALAGRAVVFILLRGQGFWKQTLSGCVILLI